MNLLELMEKRFSVRKYKSDEIEDENWQWSLNLHV